jgi:hypothetical protein
MVAFAVRADEVPTGGESARLDQGGKSGGEKKQGGCTSHANCVAAVSRKLAAGVAIEKHARDGAQRRPRALAAQAAESAQAQTRG